MPAADVRYAPAWLPRAEADALFDALMAQVDWDVHRIRMFGREVDSPRLSCWIGDPGTGYVYSRTRFEPHPWPEALVTIRERVSAVAGVEFNSVLANLYRDGGDRMGWHSDDEPELGPRPVIASVSLGGPRRFVFRRRASSARGPARAPETSPPHGSRSAPGPGKPAIALAHGSLLLMAGDTQANWQHALPRTAKPVPPRINLTFRRIVRQD